MTVHFQKRDMLNLILFLLCVYRSHAGDVRTQLLAEWQCECTSSTNESLYYSAIMMISPFCVLHHATEGYIRHNKHTAKRAHFAMTRSVSPVWKTSVCQSIKSLFVRLASFTSALSKTGTLSQRKGLVRGWHQDSIIIYWFLDNTLPNTPEPASCRYPPVLKVKH